MNAFFAQVAKEQVKQAVVAIESKTSAEIVVSVRGRSAAYRDADYLVGFIVAIAVLLTLTFAPVDFNANFFPFEVLAAFALGAVASAHVWLLKALILPRSRKRFEVARGADAYFHEAKLARTRGRTAILVYVSLFERMVCFAFDVGVPQENLKGALDAAQHDLEAALAQADVTQFTKRLTLLATVLEIEMPRAADDENELPDDVT
jgi:putative membrane protein